MTEDELEYNRLLDNLANIIREGNAKLSEVFRKAVEESRLKREKEND
jgi:hypothetical protein